MLKESDIQLIKDNYSTRPTKEIASKIGISISLVAYYAKKFNIRKVKYLTKRIYNLNHYYFDIIGPGQAYFLGLLMSDGYVIKNEIGFYLSHKDVELLELFNKELQSDYKIHTQVGSGRNLNKIYVRLRLRSSYMVNTLSKLGIIPNKTGKEIIPEECVPYKYHFLRGLIDGDGCVFIKPIKGKVCNKVVVYSASELFVKSLQNIFNIGNVFVSKRKNICHWSVYDRDLIKMLYNLVYENNNGLFLKRKKTEWEKIFKIPPKINKEIVEIIRNLYKDDMKFYEIQSYLKSTFNIVARINHIYKICKNKVWKDINYIC